MTSDNSRPPAPQGGPYPPSGERPYQPSGQSYRPAPPAYTGYTPPGAPYGSPPPPPRRNPLLVWGGVAAGLLALAAITVLVIVPIFNRSSKTEADPFASAATPAASAATTGGASKPAPTAGTTPVITAVAAQPTATAPATSAASPQPAKPAGPLVLGKGQFSRVDTIHYASGTATLGKTADGKNILRFDNFSSAQGPDLKVYLGLRPDGKQLKEGGLNLGALPATDGSYNVPIPDNVDITKYKSVVIWCEAFSVTFSVAPLA